MHRSPNPHGNGARQASQPHPGAEAGVADVESLDLTCPSCGGDLMEDASFRSHRKCGACGRHFAIGARERIGLLVDTGVFQELAGGTAPEASANQDPLPAAERLAEHQHQQVIGEAVVTGFGSVGGAYAVVVALDDHLVGHTLGALMAGKVLHAFEYARSQKLPVVLLAAGGTASIPAGPLSLAQGSRLATAAAQLHLDGVPILGVLTHPMSTGVFTSLAAHCDLLLSEPGVVLHEPGAGAGAADTPRNATQLLADGWIDGIVDRTNLASEVGLFLDLVTTVGIARPVATAPTREAASMSLPDALAHLARTERPGVETCLERLVPTRMAIRGDRISGEHPGVHCGIGRLDSVSIAYVAVSRDGVDDGGATRGEAARKIIRLARLAGRLELPVVVLLDGSLGQRQPAFSPDAAFAEAALASALSHLPVPLIAVGLGQVTGSLATILMNGDRQYLTASAVLAPPPEQPQGRLPGRPAGAVSALTARDCERLGLVDGVIPEPGAGSHADVDGLIVSLRGTLLQALSELTGTGQRRLLDTRVLRQRTLGQSTPEGLAEARSELSALQEWQRNVERNVERSIDEWRGRWEHLKASQPRISFQRPDISDLAARVRARRTELLERAGLADREPE